MSSALIGFGALFLLLFLRVPVAVAMILVGFIGFGVLLDWGPALSMIGTITVSSGFAYTLSVIPLFILMGNFVTKAGLADELFEASHAFLGHRRGGLAMATIAACGGFAAICGSSLATAATMSKVAIPSMRRFGYSDSLAAGSVAAGGTLGILIPPSVILIIYAILTEQSIAAMFAAGLVPGILGVLLYMAAIKYVTWRRPDSSRCAERMSWRNRLKSLGGLWGIIVLFCVVMGGIYGGVFTPTEAASIGAMGAFLFVVARRKVSVRVIFAVLAESTRTTAMLFMIVIGAMIFANFINLTGLPNELVRLMSEWNVSPIVVITMICVIYVALGCLLEGLSMIMLTVPVFFPLVAHLGYDLVWFGIFVVVVAEISLITPPVGLNVFVIRSLVPDIKTADIFHGVVPFIVADIGRVALLILFPPIALFLPHLLL